MTFPLTGEKTEKYSRSIFLSVKHLSDPEILRIIRSYLQLYDHVLIHISRHAREGLL
jgi:hypothetical protein